MIFQMKKAAGTSDIEKVVLKGTLPDSLKVEALDFLKRINENIDAIADCEIEMGEAENAVEKFGPDSDKYKWISDLKEKIAELIQETEQLNTEKKKILENPVVAAEINKLRAEELKTEISALKNEASIQHTDITVLDKLINTISSNVSTKITEIERTSMQIKNIEDKITLLDQALSEKKGSLFNNPIVNFFLPGRLGDPSKEIDALHDKRRALEDDRNTQIAARNILLNSKKKPEEIKSKLEISHANTKTQLIEREEELEKLPKSAKVDDHRSEPANTQTKIPPLMVPPTTSKVSADQHEEPEIRLKR